MSADLIKKVGIGDIGNTGGVNGGKQAGQAAFDPKSIDTGIGKAKETNDTEKPQQKSKEEELKEAKAELAALLAQKAAAQANNGNNSGNNGGNNSINNISSPSGGSSVLNNKEMDERIAELQKKIEAMEGQKANETQPKEDLQDKKAGENNQMQPLETAANKKTNPFSMVA